MSGHSFLGNVTVVILTWNEEENIERTLGMLEGFKRVLVIDSGSSDRTRTVVGRFPDTDFVVRTFDVFERQWTYGLSLVETEWVLTLDADYVLTQELRSEMARLQPADDCMGYQAGFEYWFWGRRLRGTLYPPKVILFRKRSGCFVQEGHTQRLRLEGRMEFLSGKIRHDDRKPLDRWCSQWRYAGEEAAKLDESDWGDLHWVDRVRWMGVVAPFLVFIYTLFGKRLVLDGWAGWGYVLQRTLAEWALAFRLAERRAGKCSLKDNLERITGTGGA
jgi:glycosyltransferase involved in cell wall biosynthesis